MLGRRVTGIDVAERLLAVARSKRFAQNLPNADFQRADTSPFVALRGHAASR